MDHQAPSSMRSSGQRILRISGRVLAVVLALSGALWVLLQTPGFQQWTAQQAASYLSKRLGTRVTVKHAYVGWLNRMTLHGLYIADRRQDTLLYVGHMAVHFTDWFPFRDTVTISHLSIQDAYIHRQRTDSVWNSAFLYNRTPSQQPATVLADPDSGGSGLPFVLNPKSVVIKNLRYVQEDKWRGKSMTTAVGELYAHFRHFDLENEHFDLTDVRIRKPDYREFRRNGLWSATDSMAFFRRIDSLDKLRSFPESWNSAAFRLTIDDVLLEDGFVEIFNRHGPNYFPGEFDARDIVISNLEGRFRQFQFLQDTLMAKVSLTANERSGLIIRNLTTQFRMHPQLMEFSDLDLQMNDSKLGPYYAMRYRTIDDMEYFIDSVRISSRLENSKISMADVARFAPALKAISQKAVLSATAEGTISNFEVRNLDLRTDRSRIQGHLTMKGLTDIANTTIFFETPGSRIHASDVAVWAPQVLSLANTPLGKVNELTYTGIYQGTVDNFLADGTISTSLGTVAARVNMAFTEPRKGFIAQLKRADLDAGKLLGINELGRAVFTGQVRSNGFTSRNPILIEGDFSSLEYAGYTYRQIIADAVYKANGIEANLAVGDPNLLANFKTRLDFSSANQVFNGRGSLAYANLKELNLTKDSLVLSGLFDANFNGKNVDDFRGYARFYDLEVFLKNNQLSLDSLMVSSRLDSNEVKTFSVATNEADMEIKGRFNLTQLPSSIQALISEYYPAIIRKPVGNAPLQDFTFQLNTREVSPFLGLIDNQMSGLNFATISGRFQSDQGRLEAYFNIPEFRYRNAAFENATFTADGSSGDLLLSGEVGNIAINDSLQIPNTALFLNTVQDSTRVRIETNAPGSTGDASIVFNMFTKTDGVEVRFEESTLNLNNKIWTLASDGDVIFKRGFLLANGIHLRQDNQTIDIYTMPSDDGYWNDVHVTIRKFLLGDVLPYVMTTPAIEGVLDADIVVQDLVNSPLIYGNYTVNNLIVDYDSIGVIHAKTAYNARTGILKAELDSRNPLYDFATNLTIAFGDNDESTIDAVVDLRNERMSLLKKYLSGIAGDIDGYATGRLRIAGNLQKPELLGKVQIRDVRLMVDYTKCTYFIDSGSVEFGDNFINFGRLQVYDQQKRKGMLEGVMYHQFFDSLSFDLRMQTDGMQVLNTSARDNDLFYGNAVGKAACSLNGPLNNLQMRITGAITDTSFIVISNKTGKESGSADFIVYKQYREQEAKIDTSVTNIHMEIDLTATPKCRIDVVMDELTGDVISATGSGNLKIRTGTTEETRMRGKYQVEKGLYNFSFQTLIKKPFQLLGGENNFIEWTGDPYNATLNVQARYTASKVSLRDLMASEQGRTVLDPQAQSYRGDVYVNATLKGVLSQPSIQFDIEFPQGSPMLNNVSAQTMMQQIKADQNELLKQVTYLIVFKSFAPYKQGTSTMNPGTELAVNTISDLLSNQMGRILTNFVQEITGDKSLNVDFSTDLYNSGASISGSSPGNSSNYDRVNFNFMLNRSYFNNRVVVNVGSEFDLSVRNTTANGFQFLPDVSVEFILTENRRLRAIVFKKDALDYAGRRNRAGVSLSYRKEFDKFFSPNKDEALIYTSK